MKRKKVGPEDKIRLKRYKLRGPSVLIRDLFKPKRLFANFLIYLYILGFHFFDETKQIINEDETINFLLSRKILDIHKMQA
jgi:hypothetical protein